MTDTPLVKRSDDDGVATLTLNRPEALNALSPGSFVELRAHVDALTIDDYTRVVILRGEGRSFCAGNDLKAIQSGERAPSPHFQAETIEIMEALPQCVIGSVRGHCFTGGLELVLGADLIVASETARFGDTHGKFAMVPTWGMPTRLTARIGPSRARDMMFTGRHVSGAEALELGLANRCVPDDELDAVTAELAVMVAAQSPWTIRHEKALMAQTAGLSDLEATRYERENSPGTGPDMLERIQAGFGKK
ncbi:MAG: enoyl-CoA hydratase/isomerase family protein [Actinomycetia bacterium]|nr:enoyl-CoA hydratase/isomerase family protein [Actinomycetes bacterium]